MSVAMWSLTMRMTREAWNRGRLRIVYWVALDIVPLPLLLSTLVATLVVSHAAGDPTGERLVSPKSPSRVLTLSSVRASNPIRILGLGNGPARTLPRCPPEAVLRKKKKNRGIRPVEPALGYLPKLPRRGRAENSEAQGHPDIPAELASRPVARGHTRCASHRPVDGCLFPPKRTWKPRALRRRKAGLLDR